MDEIGEEDHNDLIHELMKSIDYKYVSKGKTICVYGDEADAAYTILSGDVIELEKIPIHKAKYIKKDPNDPFILT